MFLSACWKTEQNPCKNKHGENCIAQVVCRYFVRLCGAAGVGYEMNEGKKTIQTYPYSNCTFHHQNSQRKQTNFTVPTNLIENFDQHNLLHVSLSAWKIGEKLCKNTHGENCVAQVVCWYFVRLCGTACWCEVSEGKKSSKPIHILAALFTTRIHKENKQILPYQPTSGKFWPTQSTNICLFQYGKQERKHARTSMVKIALRKLFAGILCGCVVLLILVAK